MSFLLLACGSQPETKDVPVHSDSIPPPAPVRADGRLKGTLVSGSGDTLQYAYNNDAHTMTIGFKNLQAELKQDTTASGLRYSNDQFVYTEWHGISTLKEKGNTVFETQRVKMDK